MNWNGPHNRLGRMGSNSVGATPWSHFIDIGPHSITLKLRDVVLNDICSVDLSIDGPGAKQDDKAGSIMQGLVEQRHMTT